MSENIKDLISQLKKRGLYNQYKRQSKYWEERFTLLENSQNNKCVAYMNDVERLYMKASNEVEKEISKWYSRYAKNNSLSLADAKKILKANELKEFHMSVDEYIRKGESLDPRWVKELERASTKVHLSRLEALQIQMRQQVELLTGKKSEATNKLLKDIYEDVYYKTAFEVQKGFGVGFEFAKLDDETIDKVLSKPWTSDGTNFSQRIWGSHRMELVDRLQNDLIMNIGGQVSIDKIISKLAKDFDVSKGRAANLVYTEKAFFTSKAENDSYKQLDLEEYEICATLDNKTSEICRFMDGKHFVMKDYKIGATAPPFHQRCRTCTVPYFNDEFTADEKRAARDIEGNYYTVPSNMKYEEWLQLQNSIYLEEHKKTDDLLIFDFKDRYLDKNTNTNLFSYNNEQLNKINIIDSEIKELYASDKVEHAIFSESNSFDKISQYVKGEKSTLEFSSEMINLLKNSKKKTINLHHIHPDDLPFSAKDLVAFNSSDKYDTWIVHGAKGSTYYLSIGGGKRSKKMLVAPDIFEELYDMIYNENKSIYKDASDYELQHRTVSEICNRLGWEYERKK